MHPEWTRTPITAQVCLTHQGFDYGARWEWHATAFLWNNVDGQYPVETRLDVASWKGEPHSRTITNYGDLQEYNWLPSSATVGNIPWATLWIPNLKLSISSPQF